MNCKLGKNVQVGQKILKKGGWKKIKKKSEEGIVLENGKKLKFGDEIFGWKI